MIKIKPSLILITSCTSPSPLMPQGCSPWQTSTFHRYITQLGTGFDIEHEERGRSSQALNGRLRDRPTAKTGFVHPSRFKLFHRFVVTIRNCFRRIFEVFTDAVSVGGRLIEGFQQILHFQRKLIRGGEGSLVSGVISTARPSVWNLKPDCSAT